jgi:hypothetical protein
LFQGVMLFAQMALACVVLARAGRSPYWAVVAIVPFFYLLVIGTWAFAFCRWPKAEERTP